MFVLIASVCNIFLDILFVALFDWNVAGTALATVLGQAVSVVFSLIYFRRNRSVLQFQFKVQNLKPEQDTAAQIIGIGVPLAVQSSAIQFSFLFVSHMVNSLGLDVSAAFGVAQKLRNLPGVLTQGLGLGASSMIGQNWGARQLNRVSDTVKWSILFTSAINLIFGLAFGLAPVLCFRGFTQDEAVLAYAGMCMLVLVAELPAKCFMPGCGALISAQGFVQFSFVMAFVDAFAGRMLFCWLLGIVLDMGALGFFLGYVVGTYLTAVPEIIYYASGLWRKRKVIVS